MICNKTAYLNTYNVHIIDLESHLIKYKYEINHLWEARIQAILLKSEDLMTFSHEGIKILNTGQHPRKVIQAGQMDIMQHPFNSCRDLKLENSNLIKVSQEEDDWIISIQEQFHDHSTHQTKFDEIYKIRIKPFDLRELLLIQSIFYSRQQFDLVKLIEMQPDNSVFLKSNFGLGRRNMINILSFDSKSI